MNEQMLRYMHNGGLTNRMVSRDGNLCSIDGKAVKLHNNGNGYLFNVFRYVKQDGKVEYGREYIHRIVAKTFLEQPEGATQVNHKDGNKANNAAENLEWVTPSNNILHAHRAGLMRKRTENGDIVMLMESEVVDCYTSVKFKKEKINDVAKRMSKSRTTISSIINKRSRRDITDLLDKQNNPTPSQSWHLALQDPTT